MTEEKTVSVEVENTPDSRRRALGVVWNTDAPDGHVWQCPDCPSWASLGGNAAHHAMKTDHGIPKLVDSAPILAAQDQMIRAARGELVALDDNEVQALRAALLRGAAAVGCGKYVFDLILRGSGHQYLDDAGIAALLRKLGL